MIARGTSILGNLHICYDTVYKSILQRMSNKRGILQDAQRRKKAKNSSDPHQLTSNNIIFTYIYTDVLSYICSGLLYDILAFHLSYSGQFTLARARPSAGGGYKKLPFF